MKTQITLALLALPLCGLGQGAMGITDTRTSLYWLPLTATTNIAENQVLSLHPGYHIATEAQVLQLWSDSGLRPAGGFLWGDTNQFHQIAKFCNAMGATSWQGGYPEAFGQYEDGWVAAIDFGWFNQVGGYQISADKHFWWSPDYAVNVGGTYIYTIVPEPCLLGYLLMALGVFLIVDTTFNYRKP